jgi:hypothetical protein
MRVHVSLCLRVCLCVCFCICVCAYVHICVSLCVCMCLCACLCMCVCVHVSMHVSWKVSHHPGPPWWGREAMCLSPIISLRTDSGRNLPSVWLGPLRWWKHDFSWTFRAAQDFPESDSITLNMLLYATFQVLTPALCNSRQELEEQRDGACSSQRDLVSSTAPQRQAATGSSDSILCAGATLN